MKIRLPLFGLIVVFIFSGFCSAQSFHYTDWMLNRDDFRLRGPVAKIEGSTPGSGLNEAYLFNKSGDLTEEITSYMDNGQVWQRKVYQFDSAGRRIGWEIYKDGVLTGKTIQKLDSKGIPSEEETRSWKSTFSYRFDDKGRILEKSTLSSPISGSSGTLRRGEFAGVSRTVYSYDNKGNRTSLKAYLPREMNPWMDLTFVYDDDNRLIEEISAQPTLPGKPPRLFKYIYKYNLQGDVVEERHYEPINESTRHEVGDRLKVLDDKGTVQIDGRASDIPNAILWSVTVRSYDYDARSNWIRIKSGNLEVARRIITYFPQ